MEHLKNMHASYFLEYRIPFEAKNYVSVLIQATGQLGWCIQYFCELKGAELEDDLSPSDNFYRGKQQIAAPQRKQRPGKFLVS